MASLELGIEPEQLDALKAAGRRWLRDSKRVRVAVAISFGLLGHALVLRPLATALEETRDQHEASRETLYTAEEARFLADQLAALADGTRSGTDAIGWQGYVLNAIEASGTRMVGMEWRPTTQEGPFRVVELFVEAEGEFEHLVDLVDRLERGPRIVRLRDLVLRPGDETVLLEATVHGLVDPARGVDRV